MKIKMKHTSTAVDTDGAMIVFGPAGEEYSTDGGLLTDDLAEQLMKKGATEQAKTPSKKSDVKSK